MVNYLLQRLILIPITLFFIILVNFVIINLAPGDPVSVMEISPEGNATRKENSSMASGSDERYLQFREFYGLTLPILFNDWPATSEEWIRTTLEQLATRKESPDSTEEMKVKDYDALRIAMGDRSRFVMPKLLSIFNDEKSSAALRRIATKFFVRGATRQAILGPNLPEEDKLYNKKIAHDNDFLKTLIITPADTPESASKKAAQLNEWYLNNEKSYDFEPDTKEKIGIFFSETRFFRYFSRVLTLDFGTLRNDSNKTVISEVVKRFKYSLTISLTPMLLTFFLCQLFGFAMALKQGRWEDHSLNVTFLILYAIPIFVVAPFLIEKVALNGFFPFTDIPIPTGGFTSPDSIYDNMVSSQRLFNILEHIALPIVAIMYGTLAVQSRLSRTAILEVLRQDYVRTARAKGLSPFMVNMKHVGRNAGITIVTSLAGSLGVILGGSLIVETLFEIDGFGKFFYDAILNRDYNVIMFSALAGSFLALLGYLTADIAYTVLDPRITLD